jgi:P27 family predicted phage terminase small subunit
MGQRGPLPNLKIVDGSFEMPKSIPRPKPSLPKCPDWLSEEAKAEWQRVAKPLYDLGLLTELDKQTLAMYCETWARYLRSQRVLAKEGDVFIQPSGIPKQRPEYYIMRDCLKELRMLINLFGLSPSARMRMQLPEAQEPDELEALLDE